MKVVVQGAGAVGGYFGGKLANEGYDVTFLVRENRNKQLEERGLKVDSVNGSFEINPTLATDSNAIEGADLVIVALKNYHLKAALEQLEILVKKGAKVLSLLNGVEHLEILTGAFGKENVIGGLCYVESTLNEFGDVVQTSTMQDVIFGALDESQNELVHELYEMMKKSNIDVVSSDEILKEVWKKYIFLSSLSGITSSMRKPIGISTQDPVTSQFLADLVKEVYDISVSRNVGLPADTVDNTLAKIHGLPENMTSSMHRDLEKGLPLELDSLHGFLIEEGKKKEINTPCLRAIYALLHPYK